MGLLDVCVFLSALVIVSSKPIVVETIKTNNNESINTIEDIKTEEVDINKNVSISLRNQIRPGMVVNSYTLELTPDVNAGIFAGRAVIQVSVTDPNTREDPFVFHAIELNVNSVMYAIISGATLYVADFNVDDDDGVLEIEPEIVASLYTFHIEYTGSLSRVGKGLFAGHYDGIESCKTYELAFGKH